MTTSGLASPPRVAPPIRRKPEPSRPTQRRTPVPKRAPFERVLAWSVGLSVLAHLLLLLLFPRIEIQLDHLRGPAQPAPAPSGAFGLEMVVPIPSENAPDVPVFEAQVQPAAPTPARPQLRPPTAGGGGPAPAQPAPAAGGSTRESLQPGYRDSRLYVNPSPLPPADERTQHERYMDRLQARIDAINDSMSVAANRERRTADWTTTDRSGKRWGLTPEGLHLGGITVPRALLPLPGATGDNQALDEDRERQRQRDEIRAQEEARERRRTQEERIEATRRQEGSEP